MNRKGPPLAAVLGLSTFPSGRSGASFIRPQPGTLVLGRSQQFDVINVLGHPLDTSELVRNGKRLKVLHYAYARGAGGDSVHPTVVPVRSIAFAFFKDVLVSDEFVSSFRSDATDFDAGKAEHIVKGRTTKDELVAMLGTPSGGALYPVIPRDNEHAVLYSYVQAQGNVFNMKLTSKLLLISFDGANIVTDVEYTTSVV